MQSRERLVFAIQGLLTAMASASGCEPEPWIQVDLSMGQLRALFVLNAGGAMRVGAIAEHLHLSPNATTAVVDHLERAGLVRRDPDPSDRRATLLALTEAGVKLSGSLLSANTQHAGRVLARLSMAELDGLHLGLSAVIRSMQEATVEAVRAEGTR